MARTAKRFFQLEAAGGLVLIGAAVLALLVANSPWGAGYEALLHRALDWHIGPLHLPHSPAAWINDGLMVLFFLVVGLEIKREVLVGELSSRAKLALPAVAAAGGLVVPSAIYWLINRDDAATIRGWAIPAATDIAFSLAVLTMLGRRAPLSLKVFLTALAILDDLAAVIIIAIFYTAQVSLPALGLAAAAFAALFALNRADVTRLLPYLVIGVLLWAFVLASGVHATVAGVLLAATIPMGKAAAGSASPLLRLEHGLHPWVTFLVLPIFGLANSGVALGALPPGTATGTVTLGIAAGLFFGKQVGVFGCAYAAVKLRLAAAPAGASWAQVYGAALLTGIGFTMSLFIGILAFGDANQAQVRMGVIAGSCASALAGAAVLVLAGRRRDRLLGPV
ncbi:MAG: Na+/H+ antiporter NhaA [Phycisphaerae bacterium]|nr:MAG: Na+/H+ antiporter NhaA [Planctomycetota bacterium]KAB2950090.1 MAG: Na+/H+ antiporter NhaA [Phycisphaerae bacterium]MBE7456422.1 Na+/H+ antiporter NhaA [Planctomycetia bacterium]MCK6465369.1 Na+/H+ antiporter NhaA [Phycisphaerae bacterium]MCL4719278.1 Na+/H+ antiporter NhaA [Phycisphaerae bacterium]